MEIKSRTKCENEFHITPVEAVKNSRTFMAQNGKYNFY